MPDFYTSSEYESMVLSGDYQISSVDDPLITMLSLKHCNWFKILENIIEFPLGALYAMGMKERLDTARFLDIALLDEFTYYDSNEEFESFKELQSEHEGIEWCSEKIPLKDFSIYRLTDYYNLWVIYVLGWLTASIFKAWQLYRHQVAKKNDLLEFYGIRGTANKAVTKSLMRLIDIWSNFSCFFLDSFCILRRKSTLKKLHLVRARLTKEKVQRVFLKAMESYEKFTKLKGKDKKVKEVEIYFSFVGSSQRNIIPKTGSRGSLREIGYPPTKNPKAKTETIDEVIEDAKDSKKKSKMQKKKTKKRSYRFQYKAIVNCFFKKFLGETIEYFLSHSGEPIFMEEIQKKKLVKMGQKRTYYTCRVHKESKSPFVKKTEKPKKTSIKREKGKRTKEKRINKKYFAKVLPFYQNRLRFTLHNHFHITDILVNNFKDAHPNFKKDLRELFSLNHSYYFVFDLFVSSFSRMLASHVKKEAIRIFKGTKIYKEHMKKVKEKRIKLAQGRALAGGGRFQRVSRSVVRTMNEKELKRVFKVNKKEF